MVCARSQEKELRDHVPGLVLIGHGREELQEMALSVFLEDFADPVDAEGPVVG